MPKGIRRLADVPNLLVKVGGATRTESSPHGHVGQGDAQGASGRAVELESLGKGILSTSSRRLDLDLERDVAGVCTTVGVARMKGRSIEASNIRVVTTERTPEMAVIVPAQTARAECPRTGSRAQLEVQHIAANTRKHKSNRLESRHHVCCRELRNAAHVGSCPRRPERAERNENDQASTCQWIS